VTPLRCSWRKLPTSFGNAIFDHVTSCHLKSSVCITRFSTRREYISRRSSRDGVRTDACPDFFPARVTLCKFAPNNQPSRERDEEKKMASSTGQTTAQHMSQRHQAMLQQQQQQQQQRTRETDPSLLRETDPSLLSAQGALNIEDLPPVRIVQIAALVFLRTRSPCTWLTFCFAGRDENHQTMPRLFPLPHQRPFARPRRQRRPPNHKFISPSLVPGRSPARRQSRDGASKTAGPVD